MKLSFCDTVLVFAWYPFSYHWSSWQTLWWGWGRSSFLPLWFQLYPPPPRNPAASLSLSAVAELEGDTLLPPISLRALFKLNSGYYDSIAHPRTSTNNSFIPRLPNLFNTRVCNTEKLGIGPGNEVKQNYNTVLLNPCHKFTIYTTHHYIYYYTCTLYTIWHCVKQSFLSLWPLVWLVVVLHLLEEHGVLLPRQRQVVLDLNPSNTYRQPCTKWQTVCSTAYPLIVAVKIEQFLLCHNSKVVTTLRSQNKHARLS